MILTHRFVMLNYPRTGSTFVRDALRTLLSERGGVRAALARRLRPSPAPFRELLLPIDRTLSAQREGRRSQHGCYAQIPRSHRGLPVVSVARHPLDREVSQYEHRFWIEHPPAALDALRARFPSFPELEFHEYLAMQAEHGLANVLKGARLRADVGPNTLHFLRFYHPEPDRALARLTDSAVDDGSLLRELPRVRFLHTERLRPELRALLHEFDFEPAQTAFLEDAPSLNAAVARAGRPWSEYFTPEAERVFRRKERLLFQVFPEYAG